MIQALGFKPSNLGSLVDCYANYAATVGQIVGLINAISVWIKTLELRNIVHLFCQLSLTTVIFFCQLHKQLHSNPKT